MRVGGGAPGATAMAPSAGVTTPETYLGAARAERFTNPMLSPGSTTSARRRRLAAERIRLRGQLADHPGVGDRRAGRLARPRLRRAPRLPGPRLARARRAGCRVLLDGRPIAAAVAGTDVHGGVVTVDRPAPLQPGRPAAGRAPRARPGAGSGGDGLCLHLRLARAELARESRRWPRLPRAPCWWSTTSRRSSRSSAATWSGRATRRQRAADGPEALRLAAEQPPRPRRPRPDAAGDRRDRGDAAAARACRRARIAVILLTARGEESDRLVGLRQRRRRLCRQALLAGRAGRAGRSRAAPRLAARADDEEAPPIEHRAAADRAGDAAASSSTARSSR